MRLLFTGLDLTIVANTCKFVSEHLKHCNFMPLGTNRFFYAHCNPLIDQHHMVRRIT
jgi:hypothetical protein